VSIEELLVTLRHAHIFITTREKMHPTGIELYEETIKELEQLLEANEPVVPRR
jgi:hypothetical protein